MLTRIMKQINDLVGEQGTRLRDRLRTIGYRVMEIARLSRCKGQEQKKKMQEKYRELVRLTRQVRNQGQRFSEEIHSGVKRAVNRKQQAVLGGKKQELDAMRHLSRKLCLRDSCRGLETGLEYGIELVKHGGDIPGQAFPSTLLERRNGKAQLEL